ncbi:hypothetical protein T440DRAFT_395850 [Plenodomus tracheiphilus IPT5]|uniref:Uncharacterized protein n=1 Tax=Plenodomus tracheiphilus IPT5 TaxID=1408161 RepID=A0A6A7B609_9PLEO|nr:hypothetical protein T440DRAFT_395850 [Plenodomus tracheiphilus IPT5]
MKPQKRSIKDFFSEVPRTPQPPKTSTTNANTLSTPKVKSVGTKSVESQKFTSQGNQSSSFASTSSTLSSPPTTVRALSAEAQLPVLSQTSANSGTSKRVVSNGQQVVLDSDSDDTDSLQSLDFGELQPKSTSTTKKLVSRSRNLSEEVADELRRPAKKGRTAKKSLAVIVETAQKNAEIERRIQEHKEALYRPAEDPIVENEAISEERLGQVVQDDEDPEKARRLYLAMQRTNTAQTEGVYYFFEATSESTAVRPKFPNKCLPKTQWASSLMNRTLRDQAFITGFAHQIFRIQELPEELASWMIDQFCYNRNEVLLTKYLEILESHHIHLRNLLDCDRINVLFKAMGASLKDLSLNTELSVISKIQGADEPVLPPSLKPIAGLLRRAAPVLRTKVRSHALHILFSVCLDSRVLGTAHVLDTIREAIEAITCNFTDYKKLVSGVGSPLPVEEHLLMQSQLSGVIPQLLSHITDPVLQQKLVCALPAGSPLTAYLQRYLAFSFLIFPGIVDVPLADPKIPQMLHKHLNTAPHFRINKHTNYSHLAARMTLLDISIGPGPLSVPYQPLVSPAPSQADSSPILAPFPDSSEIRDFNKEVDGLAQHIKFLGNSIVEAGAVVDLTILEAKDSTERLCARLEHAVRLGGKKVYNPFGGNDDEERQTKLSRFFSKPKKLSTPVPRGIFDNDDDGEEAGVGMDI